MPQESKCKYLDKEYARANEFVYSCSNPRIVHINGNNGNVLFDDVSEFCWCCPFLDYGGEK